VPDPRDQIIESFLRELVSERRPPDLRQAILRRLDTLPAAGQDDAAETLATRMIDADRAGASGEPSPTIPLADRALLPPSRRRPNQLTGRRTEYRAIALAAASILLLAAAVAYWLAQRPPGRRLATDEGAAPHLAEAGDNQTGAPHDELDAPPDETLADGQPTLPTDSPTAEDRVVVAPPPSSAVDLPAPATTAETAVAWRPGFERRPADAAIAKLTPSEIAELVDGSLTELWEAAQVTPAAPIDDSAWVMRAYSRLVGGVPSAAELSELESLVASSGRLALVDRLVNSPDYAAKFSEYWGSALAKRLLGLPQVAISDPSVDDLKNYLTAALESDRSWDEVAYELVAASGSTNPDHDDYNPATGLLVGTTRRLGSEPVMLTSHLASTFAGLDLQCAACHDVAGGNRMAHAWQFHAFFAQTRIEPTGDGFYRVANVDIGPQSADDRAIGIRYQSLDGQSQVALPALFGRPAPSASGKLATFDRRDFVADEIANSNEWRQALVDYVWQQLFNVPLVGSHSADDDLARLLAELRRGLGDQIAAHEGSLRDVIVGIVASTSFGLDVGSADRQASDLPWYGDAPTFARFYHRYPATRSAADTLAIAADSYSRADADRPRLLAILAQRQPLAAVDNPDIETVVAREALMENVHHWAVDAESQAALVAMTGGALDVDQTIRHLVWAALRRPATTEEVEEARRVVTQSTDRRQAWQDIWWALINSHECQLPVRIR
jgi:hypothetical protein